MDTGQVDFSSLQVGCQFEACFVSLFKARVVSLYRPVLSLSLKACVVSLFTLTHTLDIEVELQVSLSLSQTQGLYLYQTETLLLLSRTHVCSPLERERAHIHTGALTPRTPTQSAYTRDSS